MSNDMLGREQALLHLLPGVLGKLAVRLTGPDRGEWERATEKMLRRENPWDEPRKLLKFEEVMSVNSRAVFDPSHNLVMDTSSSARVKIRSTPENFYDLFGVELQVPKVVLRKYSLTFASRGTPMRKEMDALEEVGKIGRPQGRVFLSHIFDLLILDKDICPLARNDQDSGGYRENLFPVQDKTGKKWTLVLWSLPGEPSNLWDIGLDSPKKSDTHRRGSFLFLAS